MDMSEMERQLSAAIEAEEPPAPPPALTPSDVWDKLKERERAVQKRVNRERWSIKEEFDRTVLSINQDFDRRVDDALTMLADKRRYTLQALSDSTAKRLKDLDLLIHRMDG